MDWRPVPSFEPHPLLRSGHAQTIVAALWPSAVNEHAPVLRHVDLSDGDRLVVYDDQPVGWQSGDPVVMMVHGLGGAIRKGPLERLTGHLYERDIRVLRMEMRGVGAGMYTAKGWTHAGKSEDIDDTLRFIQTLCPDSPIRIVAYSMGGNQLLKLLGERGDELDQVVERAIAVAPPVCLPTCAKNITRGISRLYDLNFVLTLNDALRQRRRMPGLMDRKVNPLPRKLLDFDRQLTAPVCGFDSVEDYYHRASSRHVLEGISVPTLMLVADDDPVVPSVSFRNLPLPSSVTLVETRGGGHLGYLGRKSVDPDERWMDWRLLEQLTA